MRRHHFHLAACIAVLACALAADATAKASDVEIKCVHLDNRIAELHLKLRMGYSAKQGRLYRQKLAALEAERKAQCR